MIRLLVRSYCYTAYGLGYAWGMVTRDVTRAVCAALFWACAILVMLWINLEIVRLFSSSPLHLNQTNEGLWPWAMTQTILDAHAWAQAQGHQTGIVEWCWREDGDTGVRCIDERDTNVSDEHRTASGTGETMLSIQRAVIWERNTWHGEQDGCGLCNRGRVH